MHEDVDFAAPVAKATRAAFRDVVHGLVNAVGAEDSSEPLSEPVMMIHYTVRAVTAGYTAEP